LYQLIGDHGKGHVTADQKKLIVPVLCHFFTSYIDGTESMGQVTEVDIGGVEEARYYISPNYLLSGT